MKAVALISSSTKHPYSLHRSPPFTNSESQNNFPKRLGLAWLIVNTSRTFKLAMSASVN